MHLIKSPSGILHFRIRIPKKAQRYFQGRTEIKRSLMTKKKRIAQPIANKLYESHKNALRNILLELADGTKVTIDQETPEIEMKTAAGILSASPTNTVIDNLPDLVEQYLNDTKASVTNKTQTAREGALIAYTNVFTTIDHKSANRFSDTLKRLPPGFKKDNIIELAKTDHSEVISSVTHNKYIGFLSTFNNWLVRRGASDKNYFGGLKAKRTQQAHLERDPYTSEEVTLLLTSTSSLTGYQFWLPRLAMYSGARLQELCGLYVENVIEQDGILRISISSGLPGQHLKNMSSERIIPIHPDIAQDFKAYLSTLTGDRVFPELTWTEASFWGGMASKWFIRFRKKIGLKPTFHALRHTFASNLQAQGVDSRIIGELLGHTTPGETGRYTGRRPVSQLMDAIKCLKF
jgi:integrase